MTTDFFGPLYGVDHVPVGDEDLLFYWSIPASRDIANFIWDTDVREVTDPWPVMEPANLRDAMVMVIGSEDVTGHLYQLEELKDYTAKIEAAAGLCAPDVGGIRECYDNNCAAETMLIPIPPCASCGLWCEDKWCGLRGDEQTMIIEGVVTDE